MNTAHIKNVTLFFRKLYWFIPRGVVWLHRSSRSERPLHSILMRWWFTIAWATWVYLAVLLWSMRHSQIARFFYTGVKRFSIDWFAKVILLGIILFLKRWNFSPKKKLCDHVNFSIYRNKKIRHDLWYSVTWCVWLPFSDWFLLTLKSLFLLALATCLSSTTSVTVAVKILQTPHDSIKQMRVHNTSFYWPYIFANMKKHGTASTDKLQWQ